MTTGITITEALAEIKTIGKRLDTKRNFISGHLARQDGIRDPLEKDGGAPKVIAKEMQAIGDLEMRLIAIRRGIQHANDVTMVEIKGINQSISEWLTWRRDVAPKRVAFLKQMQSALASIRQQAQAKGAALLSATASVNADTKPTDFIVNVDEKVMSKELERIEEILGTLDGQLSLKNATVTLDGPLSLKNATVTI